MHGQLRRCHLGVVNHSRLSHGIGQWCKTRLQARNRRCIDNRPPATPLHGRDSKCRTCGHSAHQQGLCVVPALKVKRIRGLTRASATCVVEQNVQPPEVSLGAVNRRFQLIDFGDICSDKIHLSLKPLLKLMPGIGIFVDSQNLGTFGHETLKRFKANARCCASNGNDFVFETLIHHLSISLGFGANCSVPSSKSATGNNSRSTK